MDSQKKATHPPRLALRFFRWYCRTDRFEELEGDLEEMFYLRLSEKSTRKANWGFWLDVLRCFRPYAWRPDLFHFFNPNQHVMIRNYVKTSFRNLLKNKTFAAINIFGLALSMSICLLIILILKDQYSFDRHNENYDQVYRVLTDSDASNRKYTFASSPLPLGTALQEQYAYTEQVAQLADGLKVDILANRRELFVKGMFANSEMLNVLDYELTVGNPLTALTEPYSIVLTEKTAKKFFADEDPLGRIMSLKKLGIRNEDEPERQDCTVTGIIKDNGTRSHLQFEALVSISTLESLTHLPRYQKMPNDWQNIYQGYNYILLKDGVEKEEIELAMNKLASGNYDKEKGDNYEFRLEHLSEISPNKEIKTNPAGFELPIYVIYFLVGLGSLILLMAAFNYTNLSVARSLSRAKEIGVRKVSGATRGQVISQFLVEAVVVALLSLVLALLMLHFLTDAFYAIDPEIQKMFHVTPDWRAFALFFLFAVAVGLAAGLAPATLMARFQPIAVLKGIGKSPRRSRFNGRKILAVIQFCFSIVFIITAYTAYQQFAHVMRAELGVNGDYVICIPAKGNEFQKVENTFSQLASVETVAASNLIPNTGTLYSGHLKPLGAADSTLMSYMSITPNYFDVMKLELVAGRNFESTVKGKDKVSQVIINETAIERLGLENPHQALGAIFDYGKHPVEVIGIVKDFYFNSIHSPIGPFMFVNNEYEFYHFSVRTAEGKYPNLLSQLEEQWYAVDEVHEFDYAYYDDKLAQAEVLNLIMAKVVGFAGFLSIVIACLGLLGMAIFTTSARYKEIGIRKAHGATIGQVVILLSKGFLWVLLISIVFAIPLAYFLNNFWLENYAYRITMDAFVLLPGVFLVGLVGLFTITSQTFRAARLNPSETLRDE